MNVIHEGQEENNDSLSGTSFPSLNKIHSQEEDDAIPPGDASTSSGEINDTAKRTRNSESSADSDVNLDFGSECDDGYPTDEHTIHSFEQSKEKKTKRLSILKLAKDRIAKDTPHCSTDSFEKSVDNSSFLGNVVGIGDVENLPDDSTFLADAHVEDVAVKQAQDSTDAIGTNTDADSFYDIHASALSRASAFTKDSTIGDAILKESSMAAKMARNDEIINHAKSSAGIDCQSQSTDTYSYRRAYVENVTLGSNFTSTCSALTDDYCYEGARKVGMSEAIKGSEEDNSVDIKRSSSGPVDTDTEVIIPPSDTSKEGSLLARPPPPCLSNQTNDLTVYKNPGHLTRVVSFGEGEGYVDEEAARNYAASERMSDMKSCGWFRSSSRTTKLFVLCSAFLLIVSVFSVALALWLPKDEQVGNGSPVRSKEMPTFDREEKGRDRTADVETSSLPVIVSHAPSPPDIEFEHYLPTNSPTGTESAVIEPLLPSNSETMAFAPSFKPKLSPTNIPTEAVASITATSVPNKSPDAFIYSPSALASLKPNQLTSPQPTFTPSGVPTNSSTAEPTRTPSQIPTKGPTTVPPTPIPTEMPIVSRGQTAAPSKPTSPTQLSTQTVRLRATQDTYINETRRFNNYGAAGYLRADGSPRAWSFISFDSASQLQRHQLRQSLVSAKLRLYTVGKGGGLAFFALPNAKQWPESGLTWNNRGEVVNMSGQFRVAYSESFDRYRWYELNVSEAFQQNSGPSIVQTFLIKSNSTNGVAFASRERSSGRFSPELVLTFSSGSSSSAPESPWPTYHPTALAHPPSSIPVKNLANTEGCRVESDHDFSFAEASMQEGILHSTHVVLPSQDSYVSEGIDSDESYGSSSELVLATQASRIAIEFDLDLISLTSTIFDVVGVWMRLFIENVSDSMSISLGILPHSIHWDEAKVSIKHFGAPSLFKDDIFQLTSSHRGKWIDVDVTHLIDLSQAKNTFILAGKDFPAIGSQGKCVFASSETCHSPKLVIVSQIN